MSQKSAVAKVNDDVKVDGVNVSKVKAKLVNDALEQQGIEHDKMSITEKVQALQAFGKKLPRAQQGSCTECDGISSIELAACPFCGEEFDVETGEEATVKSAPPASVTKISDAAPSKSPKAAAKPKVVTAAKVMKPSTPPPAALTSAKKADAAPLAKFTEKDLDAATEELLEVTQRAKHNYWEMGKKLYDLVYSPQLWKLRRKAGKQLYTSFNQYVADELHVSHTTAFAMMDVSKAFTEQQVKKIGGSKLSLVLKAPETERGSLLLEAEKGASKREIQEKVDVSRTKHGLKKGDKRETGRKKMPKGNAAKTAKKRWDGRMTVAMAEATVKLDLFVKPTKPLKEGEVFEKVAKRARSLKETPMAIERLSNGVERIYSVWMTSKGLRLQIDTRRGK